MRDFELIRPLPELLAAHAARNGAKIAFEDSRRAVSYARLDARTGRLAGHLATLLRPGDRAAIFLGNRVETVESYLAIARAAAVGVPLNPQSADAELAYLLDDSGARVIITDEPRLAAVRRQLPGHPQLTILVTDDVAGPDVVSFERLAETEPALPPRDDLGLDDAAWMLYTSGTTGRPKGVLSTQRSCLWSVAASAVGVLGLAEPDRVLWPVPMFHSLAHIYCVLGVTAVGASARITEAFDAGEVLSTLRGGDFTFLVGVPTMYHYLLDAARGDVLALPGLRVCLAAGAVSPAALRASFEADLRRRAAGLLRQYRDVRADHRQPAGRRPGRGLVRRGRARPRDPRRRPRDGCGGGDRRRGGDLGRRPEPDARLPRQAGGHRCHAARWLVPNR